jgi:hypothetical protein
VAAETASRDDAVAVGVVVVDVPVVKVATASSYSDLAVAAAGLSEDERLALLAPFGITGSRAETEDFESRS